MVGMEVCGSSKRVEQVEPDAVRQGWCAARRPRGDNPRSRIAIPTGQVVPLRRGTARAWHTFKPPGAGEGGSQPPRRPGKTRLWGLFAALGLAGGLLLFAHGFTGPRPEAPEAARPYQAVVSRGTTPDPETPAVADIETEAVAPAEPLEPPEPVEPPEIPLTSPGSGETIRMLATAYTLACGNGDGVTATGTIPRPGIIAVDPRVIAHDTLVYIDDYGYFRAEDTGGVIKGNRIDVFMHDRADAMSFGKRWVDVKIIGKFDEPGLVKHFP